MFAIIIILAGQMGGGFNFNIGGKKADFGKIIDTLRQKMPLTTEAPPLPETSISHEKRIAAPSKDITSQIDVTSNSAPFFANTKAMVLFAVIVIPVLLFAGLIILLWMWVGANFSFVFIDSIMRNDASLRIPFHRNKPQGNSYFKWNIVFSSVVLLTFGVIILHLIARLVKVGIFAAKPPINTAQILPMVLRYVPVLLAAGIFFYLIAIFTIDFVLPVMYKRKINILKAWGIFFGIAKRNIGEILLYLLIKIGLSILALIAAVILTIIGIIAFLLIGGLLYLLGWFVYNMTPNTAKTTVLIFLILAGIPALGFLGLLFSLLFLPIPIFFRIFPIYVLGSIDGSLDLFAAKAPEEIVAEGGDEKYKKSMALVWFTVLAPALVALLGMLLAIAVPNIMKAKKEGRLPWIEKILPFKKMPALISAPKKALAPRGKAVTVYLKNGNSFEAEIDSETENNIGFRIEGGTFILPRSDILRMEKK
jgi:hypothetical protein